MRSIQEFNYKERTHFDYNTPYGVLRFSIEVNEIEMDVDSSSGKIGLDYNLYDHEGKVISRNILNISYEEE